MTDYFAVVDPKVKSPTVEPVDRGSARVFFPRLGKYLTYELVFEQDELDRFMMTGSRSRKDAGVCGARMTVITPLEILKHQRTQDPLQEGVTDLQSLLVLRKLLMLTSEELKVAEWLAWRSIIAGYRVE